MSCISTTNDTIVKYPGDGSSTVFPYSFTNYKEEFSTVEACVVDANRVDDPSYTYELTESNTITLNKPLANDRFLEIYLVTNNTPNTEFDSSTRRITDDNMNDVINQLLVTAQEAKDHRTNPRLFIEDMNNQRIKNLAAGVEMTDAVNVQQLSDAVGNIDDQVERAETAATEAEASAVEAAGYATDAQDSADAALISETNAAASEAAVLLQFKGVWLNDYPAGTGTGYSSADISLHDNNLWYSNVDNNTDIPEVGSQLPIPTWSLYLPGSADSAELVSKIYRATFNGDGVTKEFDLTANNALFRPTSENQIFYVSVDQTEVIDFEIDIRESDGHSVLTFTNPPAANDDPDGLFNVIVIGATPKLISLEGLPDDSVDGHYLRYKESEGKYEDVSPATVASDLGTDIILPINDTILYNNDTVANTVTWQGTARSDDNTVNIVASSPITSPALTGETAYSQWYLFVGIDDLDDTILEWDTDIDGANLVDITGAKRRVGDKKDIVFPTDGSGDLAPFERSFGTWKFELWTGSTGVSTITLNNDITNYTTLTLNVLSSIINYPQDIFVTEFLESTASNLYELGASTDVFIRTLQYYSSANDTITITANSNLVLTKVTGVK